MNSQKRLFPADVLEAAIARHGSMVYRLALAKMKNKSDAEDVFQEVFLRYCQNVESLASPDHEKAWLLRTTLNCGKNIWRSAWRRRRADWDEALAQKEEPSDGGFLWEAVAALPEKYRLCIHLFYYEDLPVARVAELLGQKESTVRTWLTRARQQLKDTLKGEYDDEQF